MRVNPLVNNSNLSYYFEVNRVSVKNYEYQLYQHTLSKLPKYEFVLIKINVLVYFINFSHLKSP